MLLRAMNVERYNLGKKEILDSMDCNLLYSIRSAIYPLRLEYITYLGYYSKLYYFIYCVVSFLFTYL